MYIILYLTKTFLFDMFSSKFIFFITLSYAFVCFYSVVVFFFILNVRFRRILFSIVIITFRAKVLFELRYMLFINAIKLSLKRSSLLLLMRIKKI